MGLKKCPKCGGPRELKANGRCGPCAVQDTREWRAKNPDLKLAQDLKKYGITVETYRRMEEEQGHRCAICPATEPGGVGRWHVDHDHKTGWVRALLCHRCNTKLGVYERFRELAEKYLRRFA